MMNSNLRKDSIATVVTTDTSGNGGEVSCDLRFHHKFCFNVKLRYVWDIYDVFEVTMNILCTIWMDNFVWYVNEKMELTWNMK